MSDRRHTGISNCRQAGFLIVADQRSAPPPDATLEEVVDFYDRGGNENPFLDRELQPLRLTEEEKMALVAFLRSLSGTVSDGG